MSLGGIFPFKSKSCIRPQSLHLVWTIQQPLNPVGQGSGISNWDLDAAFAVTERLGQTPAIGKENGQPGGHGFQHNERLPFLLDSGKDEQIGCLQQHRFLGT